MTPAQFRQAVANAYDQRDRDHMERSIRAFTDPDFARLTREQLEERRNLLHVQLATVNEHLARHDRARRGQAQPPQPRGDSSLDPTE